MHNQPSAYVPGWVPEGALRYLAHTEAGRSIRDLARSAGCHASTVLRQIRKMESRRDDPLVDAALTALAARHFPARGSASQPSRAMAGRSKEIAAMTAQAAPDARTPDAETLEQEAMRILRRMCESGAVLAVAEDMEKAVVVRDSSGGQSTRTAVVDRSIAEAMALKDWIVCNAPGRISRYHLTNVGRSALSHLMAEAENRARSEIEAGFADAQASYGARAGDPSLTGDGKHRRVRYSMAESPLLALARRRDRDGQPFLSDDLVRAGETLREDFELAQMGPQVTQNWDRFLTGRIRGANGSASFAGEGAGAAQDRVKRALEDLGPGLSDMALRCCCFLEGLETAEKQMGWSARSGKIVLRIALQRLKRHYDGLSAQNQMIG